MLRRIKLIQGIGTFTQSRASGIELAEVTIVYGENRYGKSTLCDVMHSLAEDSPDYIMNRKSIPNDLTRPPKVELQFTTSTDNVVASFENGQWQVKSPDCSKLYVFDQSFIHRNVITGQRLERPNSENMTSFILGENNTALFEALAALNNTLREERRLLSVTEEQLTSRAVDNIPIYVNSTLPAETKEQIEAKAIEHEASKQQIITIIRNIDKIKQRAVLGGVGAQVDVTPECDSINRVLVSSLENVHRDSLVTLQHHMTHHVNNSTTFKGWAGQGLVQIKDDCPFCGQTLSENAQGLIAAYQQAFNAEFDRFNNETKQALNSLRHPFRIPNTRESLIQQHQANRQVLESYIEPQIAATQELTPLTAFLEQKHVAILESFDTAIASSQRAREVWTPKLEQKYAIPYELAEEINFNELTQAATTYNQAIYDYWVVAEQINVILNTFKASLDEAQLNNQLTSIAVEQARATSALKRIELEPLCVQYRQKLTTVNRQDTAYRAQKLQLEQSQTTYLDTYFDLINQLFRQLGSRDFEIIKAANNRGRQVIYDLRVKFKGEDIPADRISTIFSESDRRALALCIFLAKVMSLPAVEKAKAILVLDDPVTSFDNERIALILNKLDELQRTVKQFIITTHYKGMAAKAVKKFRQCAKSVKLVHGVNTCDIEAVDNNDMMATEHDLAFDKIKSFVSRETNDDILTSLRPFFEEEIRYRYKKQLVELGRSRSDLSVCINALRDGRLITADLEARLNSIRDTLNTPMHELGGDALENTRALAGQILDVVYNEL